MGPSDASGVVWASGIFLSIFFLLFPSSLKFLCYLVSIYVLHRRRGLGGATKKKTRLNDARCVIWAPGTSFFVISSPSRHMSTSAKMGPNDTSGVVWALDIRDVFFLARHV